MKKLLTVLLGLTLLLTLAQMVDPGVDFEAPVAAAPTGIQTGTWRTYANGDYVQGLLLDRDYI